MKGRLGDAGSSPTREWRRERRMLLLGPLATWAVSAGAYFGATSGGVGGNDRAEASTSVGRGGMAITGSVSTTILREITFDRPSRVANHMAWSADGERLAIGGALDSRMSVLDVRTGRQLPAPGEQLGGVKGLAYSPDGRYLAVIRGGTGQNADPTAPRYTVSLWDARTSALVQNVVESDRAEIGSIAAHELSFSSDSRYLVVAYLKQTAVYAAERLATVDGSAILPRASRCAFRPGRGGRVS